MEIGNEMKLIVLIAATLMLLLCPSRAEISIAPSIEWLACESEVILVGKITKIDLTKGVHAVTYEDCNFQIQEVIKGDIKGEEVSFCIRTLSEPTAKAFLDSKDGILLFLSKSTDHGSEQHLDNKYVLTSDHTPLSIFDLSNGPKVVYSKQMTILTDKKEILDLTRLWSHSKISHSIWSEIPPDSPIFARLYAGSTCYLTVPAEETYHAKFMKLALSDKPHERKAAASELYKFPGEETERVLRELLKDDTVNFWYSSADTILKVEFGIRARAYSSLKELGKPVPESIQLEREPTKEEQRSLRQSYWRKSFENALADSWKVISIEDGDTRQVEKRDTTAIIVTCGKEEERCRITLIPKEWDQKNFPEGERLGINGRDSQGARYFFLKGTLPQEVKEKLIKHFRLERF